ncbi:MAG: hypothetical protein AAF251_11315 [Pseudomonadota bacterium]
MIAAAKSAKETKQMSNEPTHEHEQSKKQPTVIRDGRLKATLWENESERGPYVSIDVSRTYTDEDGNPRDSRSIFVSDALRASELMREAYSKGRTIEKELRREHQAQRSQEQGPER